MISGRGLGHTGGTLDKLESIPGLKTDFTLNEMHDILGATGIFIVSPTKKMVPADKILYATRDITSTVANKSLITGGEHGCTLLREFFIFLNFLLILD